MTHETNRRHRPRRNIHARRAGVPDRSRQPSRLSQTTPPPRHLLHDYHGGTAINNHNNHPDDGSADFSASNINLDIRPRRRKHDDDWGDNHVTFHLYDVDPARVHVYVDGIVYHLEHDKHDEHEHDHDAVRG